MRRSLTPLRRLLSLRQVPWRSFSSRFTAPSSLSFPFSTYTPPVARFYSEDMSDESDSFWKLFVRTLRDNIAEDEELLEETEKLADTKTARQLSVAAEKATEVGRQIYDSTEGARETVAEAAKLTGDALYTAADGVGVVVDKIAETAPVRALLDELNAEYLELLEAHYSFRSDYARKKDAERGIFFNPYTRRFEKMEDLELDNDTQDVVLLFDDEGNVISSDNSALDPNVTEPGFLSRLSAKVFPQSERAKVLAAIIERDPAFNLDLFIGNCEHILIPRVLQAFFAGDKAEIRRYLSTSAYRQAVWPLFQAREQQGQSYRYTNVLTVRGTDLYNAFFDDEVGPVLLLSSSIQYVHCVEDIESGEVVAGGDNDIRERVQMFAMCLDPSGATLDWEIVQLMLGSTMKLAT